MEPAVWTVIAVLAATNLGSLFYLGARIDAMGARLDARIDAMTADLGGRIDAVTADLGGRIDAVTGRLDAQNGRIDVLAQMMADHVRRHAG
jgi:hypothetical protein